MLFGRAIANVVDHCTRSQFNQQNRLQSNLNWTKENTAHDFDEDFQFLINNGIKGVLSQQQFIKEDKKQIEYYAHKLKDYIPTSDQTVSDETFIPDFHETIQTLIDDRFREVAKDCDKKIKGNTKNKTSSGSTT